MDGQGVDVGQAVVRQNTVHTSSYAARLEARDGWNHKEVSFHEYHLCLVVCILCIPSVYLVLCEFFGSRLLQG